MFVLFLDTLKALPKPGSTCSHQEQQQQQQHTTATTAAAVMSDSDSDSEQLTGLQQHDEDWEDWAGGDDEGGDEDVTRSLFDDSLLPSPEAAFDHDAAQHGFDLRQYRIEVGGGMLSCELVWGCRCFDEQVL